VQLILPDVRDTPSASALARLLMKGQCSHRGATNRLPCCSFTIFMRNVYGQSRSLVRTPQPQSPL